MSDILNQLRYWQDRANHAEKKAKQEAARAAELEAENKRLRDALERFTKIDLTSPIGDAIAWDILNARQALKGGEG